MNERMQEQQRELEDYQEQERENYYREEYEKESAKWIFYQVTLLLNNGEISTYKSQMQGKDEKEAMRKAMSYDWKSGVKQIENVTFYETK